MRLCWQTSARPKLCSPLWGDQLQKRDTSGSRERTCGSGHEGILPPRLPPKRDGPGAAVAGTTPSWCAEMWGKRCWCLHVSKNGWIRGSGWHWGSLRYTEPFELPSRSLYTCLPTSPARWQQTRDPPDLPHQIALCGGITIEAGPQDFGRRQCRLFFPESRSVVRLPTIFLRALLRDTTTGRKQGFWKLCTRGRWIQFGFWLEDRSRVGGCCNRNTSVMPTYKNTVAE